MLLFLARNASARVRARPLFEPTDLELETPGILDVDVQVGMVRSRGPWRVVIPDFEVDLGLFDRVEFGLDGAYAIEGPSGEPFRFDHAAPDSLWPSLKLGVVDLQDAASGAAFAFGVQLGPKLPVAAGAHGLGVEGLALAVLSVGSSHLVLNAGALTDPAPDATSGRPVGVEGAITWEQDLDRSGRASLSSALSGVRFFSNDAQQLLATLGFTFAPTDSLELSLTALEGLVSGSDRFGLLLGVSPKLRLWK
jgi:hypothetical protein